MDHLAPSPPPTQHQGGIQQHLRPEEALADPALLKSTAHLG